MTNPAAAMCLSLFVSFWEVVIFCYQGQDFSVKILDERQNGALPTCVGFCLKANSHEIDKHSWSQAAMVVWSSPLSR